MKGVVSRELGEVEVEEVAVPSPGPDEVLIKVNRVQLSATECRLLNGEEISYYEDIRRRIQDGGARVFGHEFSGEVVDTGRDVTGLSENDRVYAPGKIPCHDCSYCKKSFTHLCPNKELIGYHRPGALSEYTCLPEETLCSVPESVSDSEAAAMQPLASAFLSVHEAEIESGDVVAIIGSGVMGYNCGQIASVLGATQVFAIDLVDEKLNYAEGRGMKPINARESDPAEVIREVTDGVGADVVFEAVGGEQDHVHEGAGPLAQAYDIVRQGGKIVQIGNIPGDVAVHSRDMRKKSVDWLHPNLGIKPTGPNADTGEIAAQLVANGDVSLTEYITHERSGLESIHEAVEITLDPDVGLGPVQIIVS